MRQLRILSLIAQGVTDNQIGVQLVTSPQTIGVQVRAIRRALGAPSRSQAVALVFQQGLLPAGTGDPPETSS